MCTLHAADGGGEGGGRLQGEGWVLVGRMYDHCLGVLSRYVEMVCCDRVRCESVG